MPRFTWWTSLLLGGYLITLDSGVYGQQDDEALIRQSAANYVEAFNRHDAAAVAGMWMPAAVYENPVSGEQVSGRPAIEEQLQTLFDHAGKIRLEVDVTSVRFLSPHVAIEEGIARVFRDDQAPDATRYSALHVKSGDQWLIDRMTEQPWRTPPSSYSRLQSLEWMIGTWVDEDEAATVETTCQWTKNRNFLLRSFKISVDGQIDLSGIQLIGWDPADRKIRSWVFDSDGGFGEATWRQRGDRWVVSSAATLPDGKRSSSVNIISQIDDATMSWQSTGRELDGEILPNIEPIHIRKQPQTGKQPESE